MKKKYSLVFLLCLFPILWCSFFAWGEEPDLFYELLDRRDGLASLSISSLAQDDRGFLWVGTQGGLHRYNGSSMTLFEHQPFQTSSLTSNVIQSLYFDGSHNTLWIGTYQGLNSLDLTTNTFKSMGRNEDSQSLRHNVVTAIYRDMEDRLWVGTLGGLHVMNADGEGFTWFPPGNEPGSITSPTIRGIHQGRDGTLWVMSNGGLYRYNGDTQDFSQAVGLKKGNFPSDLGMVIREDSRGYLYLGFWDGGIAVYNPAIDTVVETIILDDLRIYSMILDKDENLWVGTWGGGLFFRDRQTGTVSRSKSQRGVKGAIAGDIIYSLLEDRTGMVWVGIHGGGLNKYNPLSGSFQQLTHDPNNPESLTTGSVTAIFRDTKQRYWFGTYNGGLNLMEDFGSPVRRFVHAQNDTTSLSNNIIRAITQDSRGAIWVATNQWINRYNEDGTFTRFRTTDLDGPLGIPDQTIMAILPHTQPGQFWLGTYSRGVVLWSPDEGVIETLELPDNLVYTLVRDSRNRLWIATNRGVHLYDGGEIQSLYRDGTRSGLGGQTARAIVLDKDENLWVGTVEGGVTVISPDFQVLAHYGKEEGLVSYTVSGLLLAADGTVWVTTNRGVNQISLEEGVLLSITQEHGLTYDEFSSGSFLDTDGRLILGNVDGVSRFNPQDLTTSFSLFPPVISQVYVQDFTNPLIPPAGQAASVFVPWNQNNVFIEFATLDFSGSRHNRFFYQLEGFDKDWIDGSDRRQAGYTNLPPGKYTFRVALSAQESLAGFPPESTLKITVESPPHQRWWAIVFYFTAAGLLVYGISQIRVRNALSDQVTTLERVQQELETANKKLNYLSYHDSLSGLGNHRMFTNTIFHEWTHCRRSGQPISLISVDIDFFKKYNDTLGHPAGDKVIEHVSQVLSTATNRSTDMVCRVGGEEFSVILPDTPGEGVLKIAQDIQRFMNEKNIPHPDSEVAPYLTLSLGIATIVPQDDRVQDLIDRADEALYRAKSLGRNQIIQG